MATHVTANDVLKYMTANAGKNYQAYALSVKFKVGLKTIKILLSEIEPFLTKEKVGKFDLFCVKSNKVTQEKSKLNNKVWQMPQSMIDALARAREGRTEDFSLITIVSNVPETYKAAERDHDK